MKKFFNCAGVDMGSKELADKLNLLSQKQASDAYGKQRYCYRKTIRDSRD